MQSSFLNDLAGNKVISIKGIPVHLNKGVILRRYFSRFGDIRSVRCMPAKRSAYIHFETHVSTTICIYMESFSHIRLLLCSMIIIYFHSTSIIFLLSTIYLDNFNLVVQSITVFCTESFIKMWSV